MKVKLRLFYLSPLAVLKLLERTPVMTIRPCLVFFYFINNLHIYDNQFEQAQELLRREPSNCQPRLVLNVPDGTNFFDIKAEDFELVDYDPVKPQLKFDLAI